MQTSMKNGPPVSGELWLVDTSVLIRILDNVSPTADAWLKSKKGSLVGSELLEVETFRVLRNRGQNVGHATALLDEFTLIAITPDVMRSAREYTVKIRAGDAIHLATAELLKDVKVVVATHDTQQAAAAAALGLAVIDPITDDPLRPAVA